jgi:hypothetical protein
LVKFIFYFYRWFLEKRFHNKETITAFNYKMEQTPFKPPFPSPAYATKIINPFLNSMILANHDQVERLSANVEILIKGIVSLL